MSNHTEAEELAGKIAEASFGADDLSADERAFAVRNMVKRILPILIDALAKRDEEIAKAWSAEHCDSCGCEDGISDVSQQIAALQADLDAARAEAHADDFLYKQFLRSPAGMVIRAQSVQAARADAAEAALARVTTALNETADILRRREADLVEARMDAELLWSTRKQHILRASAAEAKLKALDEQQSCIDCRDYRIQMSVKLKDCEQALTRIAKMKCIGGESRDCPCGGCIARRVLATLPTPEKEEGEDPRTSLYFMDGPEVVGRWSARIVNLAQPDPPAAPPLSPLLATVERLIHDAHMGQCRLCMAGEGGIVRHAFHYSAFDGEEETCGNCGAPKDHPSHEPPLPATSEQEGGKPWEKDVHRALDAEDTLPPEPRPERHAFVKHGDLVNVEECIVAGGCHYPALQNRNRCCGKPASDPAHLGEGE